MFEARLLGGRYRLLAELGRGGMGTVWRARDELLDRFVAVKEVTLPGADRAMREARIAARLSHPHIAAVYDVVLADERPWIVLQLIPSRTLAVVVEQRGPLPLDEVVRLGQEVLAALRYAHDAGILHRDVKPANILLDGSGRAFLADFGLAITAGDESDGGLMGTPAYLAPERAAGAPATARADLWSLGATLYSAVEGRPPFHGSTELDTLAAVLRAGPAPFLRAGPLAPVIAGLLARDPSRRPDAAELDHQLVRLASLRDQDPDDTAGMARTPYRCSRAS